MPGFWGTVTSRTEPPPMGSRRRKAWDALVGLNAKIYRASGGRLLGKWDGEPLLLLHHVGRKSGQHRVAPVLYMTDGENLVVVASMGGQPQNPGWYYNLSSAPDTEVEIRGKRHPVRARTSAGEERSRLWSRLVEVYPAFDAYQARTQREIPVVVLEPR